MIVFEAVEPVTAVDLFREWWPWCQAAVLIAVFAGMALLGIKL